VVPGIWQSVPPNPKVRTASRQGALGAQAPTGGFDFRVQLGTFERNITAAGGLPKWDGPARLAEKSLKTPLTYIEGFFRQNLSNYFREVRLFFGCWGSVFGGKISYASWQSPYGVNGCKRDSKVSTRRCAC
jgi:hypothetical protein